MIDRAELLDVLRESHEQVPPALGMQVLAPPKHDRHSDLVSLSEETLGVGELGFEVVVSDGGAQLELLHHDARFVLAGVAHLLRRFEAVLPVVHDADYDRAGVRSDLDEVEPRFFRDAPGFFDGNDADLLSFGADETDGTEADLLVHADLVVDAAPP